MKNILITGGAGFVGSHICLELLKKDFNIYVADSFINSSVEVFEKLKLILNDASDYSGNKINVFEGDIRDKKFLNTIFFEASRKNEKIDCVIHLAGLKSVRESVENPLLYWDVNVNGSLNLLKVMANNNCKTILFSSSATVYGNSGAIPFKESNKLEPVNPYGQTKATIEKILRNISDANSQSWRIFNLRYFNPIGAHPSGIIGENPILNAENIFPSILQVAAGIREKLLIFGNDWDTIDGTCQRDYIHIIDLARAHVKSIEYLAQANFCNLAFNVGRGESVSVLQLLKTFERVNNLKVSYQFAKRREGDVPVLYADTSLFQKKLKWKTEKNLEDMCKDGWEWQQTLLNK